MWTDGENGDIINLYTIFNVYTSFCGFINRYINVILFGRGVRKIKKFFLVVLYYFVSLISSWNNKLYGRILKIE